MTPSWFDSPAKIEALVKECDSWDGTPFFPNSAVKGRGACCHFMAAAIYDAIGCMKLNPPSVAMVRGRFAQREDQSLLVKYADKCPEFSKLPYRELPIAGDLIGICIERIGHHCGIMLPKGEFFHCMEGLGAMRNRLADATWASRFCAAWRPKP